ncbi:hypothetical protein [Ferrovibrio sp.]|uniref:hypothetical protein n=1 Tax=Ferrovibrio sp. TaxID=1917215 RepID=UPI0035B46A15
MNLKPLTTAGLIGSAVWGGFVVWYLFHSNQIETVLTSAPNNFGDFWSGTFAPLAFWWLVLGYFQQGVELRQNVEALKQQSKETANLVVQAQAQADAIKANEQHARFDTYIRLTDIIISQLSSVSASLALSGTSKENKGRWLAAFGDGEKYVFFNMMLEKFETEELIQRWENIFRNEQRRKGFVLQYIELYEVLIFEGEKYEANPSIIKAFNASAMGQLYIRLCRYVEQESKISALKMDDSIYKSVWSS